jgi:hypothetical protein
MGDTELRAKALVTKFTSVQFISVEEEEPFFHVFILHPLSSFSLSLLYFYLIPSFLL